MSVLLGIVLAVGTWITTTTMYAGGKDGGIVENFGQMDPVIFLEISLTENWLIFITRANGPFWSSIPSWQLTGAILVVDIIATCFTIWGWFVGGQTSIVAVVRIWIFSFGVFCIMGGVYYILQGSTGFDNLMHGKSPKGNQKQRSLEDFGKSSPPRASNHVAQSTTMNPPLTRSLYSCLSPARVYAAREVAISATLRVGSMGKMIFMRRWSIIGRNNRPFFLCSNLYLCF
jgi:H+-transporting ATPase